MRRDPSLAAHLGKLLVDRGATVATAESCTGGLVADLLTDTPGSSRYMLGGVVAYTNEVKHRELDVPTDWIEQYDAVSAPVVLAMAVGIRKRFGANYGLAVSGVAGPGGGTPDRPVGTVHLGLAHADGVIHLQRCFPYDRRGNKLASAFAVIDLLRCHLLAAPSDGARSFSSPATALDHSSSGDTR